MVAQALLKTLAARGRLSEDDEIAITELATKRVTVPKGQNFVAEGSTPTHSCLMISGYSARFTLLSDGTRQITAIHVPGDFVDLHSLFLRPMDHGVMSIDASVIALVHHAALKEVIATRPNLTFLLWTLTTIDGAIFRNWLVATANLRSQQRIARFLCEIYTRLNLVDMVQGYRFELPIKQGQLGEILGISIVQTNRSLQALRKEGLIQWVDGFVTILNWDRLAEIGEFDPTYLNIHFPA